MFSYMRNMDQSDLEPVLAIEQRCYDFPWSVRGFENSLDRGLNYVFCRDNDEIIGYACCLTVLDEVELLNFCIAPAFQGKGVGKKALEVLLERLSEGEFRIVFLEVRDSNSAGRRLYLGSDFNEDGVRKDYYRCRQWDEETRSLVEGKEDAILMSRPLS
ncbi:ribosomal protein S18-alanine N-acetyltransferase [Thiomicrorhabdus sp.]|uniref:ribosomal protein S18-alanine N-acetyltransferase n=1 Tax=Thiomicrorhabdus sp. TaxID=2039724 RepID=UPI0029C655CF|nr:ribosomal protein S18-alanine N-acetyltransferase [Thiomicrorhabdus sp.]